MQKQAHKILSIIPARSGSTEVKNKNTRKLGGRPLIFYTINASLKSMVSRTIVSTDDPTIQSIAKRYGAEVPFLRPKKYSTSKSTSMSVILHCLKYLKKSEKYFPDYVVYLQPTSPFRTFNDINNGIKKILNSNATSLTGIMKVSQHPFWMLKRNWYNDMLEEFIKIKNKPLRRQDLPPIYCINDALFISKAGFFDHSKSDDPIIDLKSLIGLEMESITSFDINSELDFKIAECVYGKYENMPKKNTHQVIR